MYVYLKISRLVISRPVMLLKKFRNILQESLSTEAEAVTFQIHCHSQSQ